MQVPDIANFEGLDFKAFDQLGIDGLDVPPASMPRLRGDKRVSLVGGLHIAFEGRQQANVVVLLQFLLSGQI